MVEKGVSDVSHILLGEFFTELQTCAHGKVIDETRVAMNKLFELDDKYIRRV